jgi:hypothetical protein
VIGSSSVRRSVLIGCLIHLACVTIDAIAVIRDYGVDGSRV